MNTIDLLKKLHNAQTIGIFGFGVTGKSILLLCKQRYPQKNFIICSKALTDEDKKCIQNCQATYIEYTNLNSFFANTDIIIPSPGIDLHPYAHILEKCIHELDIFALLWQGKTIALTGSIGKTSTLHLIHHCMTQSGLPAHLTGNVGYPLADLIRNNNKTDQWAIAELSSFQLEYYTQPLNPTVAILTNILPNHLDRHKTIELYRKAKYAIFNHLPSNAYALLPLAEYTYVAQTKLIEHPGLHFFTSDISAQKKYQGNAPLFYFDSITQSIILQNKTQKHLYTLANDHVSFAENWLIALACSHLLDLNVDTISTKNTKLPAHRCDHVGQYKNITFYNDSKSTVIQATLAATKKIQQQYRYTIVIIGGTSKGVDRTPYLQEFKNTTSIICFGAEYETLYNQCKKLNLQVIKAEFLNDAFEQAIQQANKIDQKTAILFSPGGASFDQFTNYQERGNAFVELVKRYIENKPQ